MRSSKWVVAATMAMAVLTGATPAAAGTLDQQNSGSEAPISPGSVGEVCSPECADLTAAQTFTAGITGKLDQVDLYLFRTASVTAPLTVEIRTVGAGCPSSGLLARETVAASEIPIDSAAWVPVSFASSADVVAGTQYAIVIYTEAGSDPYQLPVTGDTYNRGQLCVGPAEPTGWTPAPFDAFFKTYVVPAPPPPPAVDCQGATTPSTTGTEGDDNLVGTQNVDAIFGLGGDDELDGVDGDDCLDGGDGDDRASGGAGDDLVKGGDGGDRVRGVGGKDRLKGQDGKDRLNGGEGSDKLSGGPSNDKLNGGAAEDTFKGNAGNDDLNAVDAKRDRVNCGGGDDKAVVDPIDRVSANCETVREVEKD